MEELKKAQDLSVKDDVRKKSLREFYSYVNDWQIALPNVEPLVLDFGLGDFYTNGLIECWIVNEVEAGYCAKYLFVFDGQTCPKHTHQVKAESFFMIKGELLVRYGDKEIRLKPGDVFLVEPSRYHSMTGIGPALFLEVSKPCYIDDNYFANTNIPIGGNYRKE